MKWINFLIGAVAVIVLTFVKTRLIDSSWPIDLSLFLVFFIIRAGRMELALIQVFLLGLSMDFILQVAYIKGLSGMGQLLLVYAAIHMKHYIAPSFEDFFLFIYFAVFYIGNYFIGLGLSRLFGVHYETITPGNLFLYAGIHTVIFAVLLTIAKRLQRGEP